MTTHPQTYALATLMSGGSKMDGEWQTVTALSIVSLFDTMCDEQKADLYALLVEKYDPHGTFVSNVDTISECLWNNQNLWARR